MRNRIVLITCFSLAFLLKGSAPSLAGEHTIDPREMAIDRAVGGMEEGSRILSPEMSGGKRQVQQVPGKGLHPSMDTRATTSGSGASHTFQAPVTPAQPTESMQPATPIQPIVPGIIETPLESPVTETPADQTPIVETPIETPIEIPEIPAIEQPVEGIPDIETPPLESPIEETDRSIIEIDADANLSGDEISVDAGVSIEPEAEGGLLDVEADTTTDIVQEELTTETGLEVDVTQDTTTAESILGTETGTTDSPPSGEVEAGLEADVEGTGAGDVVSDAADGLSGL